MSKKREVDIDQLRDLIEVQKLQHRIVSELTGIPAKKMTKFCRRCGITTQRTGPRNGEGHPCWKGGRILSGGYWYVYSPDHPNKTQALYVLEHRLVKEKELGRFLDPSEVVHHMDGDRQNNSPANLIVFQHNADHLRHELKGKVPKWTEQGFLNMSVNKRKYQGDAKERQRQAQLHCDIRRRNKVSDGNLPLLPNDHPTL